MKINLPFYTPKQIYEDYMLLRSLKHSNAQKYYNEHRNGRNPYKYSISGYYVPKEEFVCQHKKTKEPKEKKKITLEYVINFFFGLDDDGYLGDDEDDQDNDYYFDD